eukprot:GHVP01056830.1.p1 GENE.GHVP01056830.1~~GHVP01056830.1.p1  ORF type:complete len:112 (-),score=11.27 GHVP01056830.1:118-453(-)
MHFLNLKLLIFFSFRDGGISVYFKFNSGRVFSENARRSDFDFLGGRHETCFWKWIFLNVVPESSEVPDEKKVREFFKSLKNYPEVHECDSKAEDIFVCTKGKDPRMCSQQV